MRIGIITFHRALNLGAKLQVFALQDVLSRYHDVQILDYRCEKIEKHYYKKKTLKTWMYDGLRFIVYPEYFWQLRKRRQNYELFDKRLHVSEAYTVENIQQADDNFDAFVAGSDQVWNMEITGNDSSYFLGFTKPEKRFSYAASMGSYTQQLDESLLSVLAEYRRILVRERKAADFLREKLPETQISVTVDPVFLLTRNEWINKLDLKGKNNNRPYVLMYYVDESHQTYAIEKAKKTAQKYGWDIIFVNGKKPLDNSLHYQNDVGPEEFVNLILHAECVFTTSFHALSFSLILNTPFFFELMKAKVNTSDRLKNLSDIFSLSDYEIRDGEAADMKTYPWEAINRKIAEERMRSATELLSALQTRNE